MAEAKLGVVGALEKADDFATATVNAVSGTMEHTLKGTRALGKELGGLVFETVAGLVLGTAEAGMKADHAAKSIMTGSIRGAHQVGRDSLDTVSGVAASLVKSMSHAGGNIVNAAQGAVLGAIDAARDCGLNVEETASAAASGAVHGASEIGPEEAAMVRHVLIPTVAGVAITIREPMERNGA
jgi:hypothetical protein